MKRKTINADIVYEEYDGQIIVTIVDRDEKDWVLCGTTGEDCLKLNPTYFND